MAERPLIYIIAGEPSGDALGAPLMAEISRQTQGAARFVGIGGEQMTAQGLDSLVPLSELSVMGLAEVVPRIPRILSLIRRTAADIRARQPDVVVTIDAPDFCLRVAKKLRGAGIPIVHFVAPTVWAWKPGRAKKIARLADHLLVLYPFEPPYFEREGLSCTFVGHPVVESGANSGNGPGFRQAHGIAPEAPVICVLPGSRGTEVVRHMPIFGQAIERLAGHIPGLRVILPTLESVGDMVSAGARGWPLQPIIVDGSEKYGAFAAAHVAIAASGSVALELAAARLPTVTAYKTNPITAWLTRRMVRIRFANLVNLMNDREVVPEFVFEACTPGNLASAAERLLTDPNAARDQVKGMQNAISRLNPDGDPPSRRAGRAVLDVIAGK